MYEPDDFHLRMLHGTRHESINDAVVRVGQKVAQRTDVEIRRISVMLGEVPHQPCDGSIVGRRTVDALGQYAAKHRYRLGAGPRSACILVHVGYEYAEPFGAQPPRPLERLALLRGARIDMPLRELRMRRLTVVALHIILDGELPVGVDRITLAVRDFRRGPAMYAR